MSNPKAHMLPLLILSLLISSAFEDSRFDPIALHEVPQLSCGVSLLVKFEPAGDYRDWVVGVHGIHIYFAQSGRQMSAVFLPEVAAEHGELVWKRFWKEVEYLGAESRRI